MSKNTAFFVGRQDELKLIRLAIQSNSRTSHVFLIQGSSGIGKSCFLQEIPNHEIKEQKIIYAKKLDCYETYAHAPFSIEKHLAKVLGPFKNFEISIDDWYRNRWAGSGLDTTPAYLAVRESFLKDYNALSRQCKFVLFFDTVEVSLRSDLWERLVELAPYLDNTILILAGQRFGNTKADLEEKYRNHNINVTSLSLDGLKQDEVDIFVSRLSNDAKFSEEYRQKLRLLTNGKPVLLTLAFEWLRRSLPLRELQELSLSEINANLGELQQKFEQSLVQSILQLSNSVDQAVLQMAWIFRRFDVNILKYLFGLTRIEAQKLLKELKSLPFVRILPNNVCVLHDNVRDLVVKYDWPIVDTDGSYRKYLDRQMVSYYENIINKQNKDIAKLRIEILASSNLMEEYQKTVEALIQIETQRWINEAEKLFYSLRCDAELGIECFVNAFDEVSSSNRDLRGLLIYEITDHDSIWLEKLPFISQYSIKYRLAIAKSDSSNNDEAYKIFEELIKYSSISDNQRIDLLIHLGGTTTRLGNVSGGEKRYEQALSLSLSMNDSLAISRSYLELAWINRIIGNWQKAIKYYRLGLEQISNLSQNNKRYEIEAWLRNGLGYVLHLMGNGLEAESHCLKALEIWRNLNSPLQLGSIYSTLGEVKTGQDKFEDAFYFYNQALNIFQEHRAWEWQVIVYHELAYSCWNTADLENAWTYILRSRKLASERGIVKELGTIYHRLGLLVLDDYEDFQDATRHFERGIEESRKQSQQYMLLENLVALMDIASRTHNEEKFLKLRRQISKELKKNTFRYPLIEGRIERLLAQWCFDKKDYDASFTHYKKAIPMIAEHGGYGRYRLSTELIFLKSHLAELDKDVASKWAELMLIAWSRLDVFSDRADSLSFLEEFIIRKG